MILPGDVLGRLAGLPDRSVQCCVTSPPYWGLRNYKADGQLGLEPVLDCLGWATGSRCGVCYICRQTAVFREVRRVLRDDGTCWIDIGDGYNNFRSSGFPGQSVHNGEQRGKDPFRKRGVFLLKEKDLCGVPWRLAMSLQESGWYWRSVIAWAKKSPMPESVTDRPTSSWEPIHLFSKSASYFFDSEAVKEDAETAGGIGGFTPRAALGAGVIPSGNMILDRGSSYVRKDTRNQRNVWHLGPEPSNYDYCRGCDTLFTGASRGKIARIYEDGSPAIPPYEDGRKVLRLCPNCQRTDAWVAHYASFPTAIPRRAILAGTSQKGACSQCGSPWERVVERKPNPNGITGGEHREPERNGGLGPRARDLQAEREMGQTTTTGWRPTCSCGADVVPCVCLDPYCGTGTTLIVARQLGRTAIGIELSDDYTALARARLRSLAAQERLAL